MNILDRRSPLAWLSGIYLLTCVPTGEIYVGSALKLRTRQYKHFEQMGRGAHPNVRIQRRWNKYGSDGFVASVLLVCDRSDLLLYEQQAIDALQPTLNILRLAGSSLGRKYTPEAYANVAAAARANAQRPEVRAKMSAARRGIAIPPEQREKIRASLKGRPRPPEVIARMKAGWLAKRAGRPPKPSSPRKGLGRHPDWKERLSAFYRDRREGLGLPPKAPKIPKGRKHSAETRAKMSASRRGRPKSAEWHAKHAAQSALRRGIPRSPKVIEKMRATIQAKKRAPIPSQGALSF